MPKPYYHIDKCAIAKMIRVNHAGEFGAEKIYQGQISASTTIEDKELFQQMLEQEAEHLAYFKQLLKDGKSRPTLLLPCWRRLGYFLGFISRKLGREPAMLVTEKIEEIIIEHYQLQINLLKRQLASGYYNDIEHKFLLEFLAKLEKFKEDEAHHLHVAVENDSANSILYRPISFLVAQTCQLAISLSKVI